MQHGFARGMKFIPEERVKKLSFDRMVFKLKPTEATSKIFNHHFEYRFEITLRSDCLEWDIVVINEGKEPFTATLGLHNYFDVSSLKNVVVKGPFKDAKASHRGDGKEFSASRYNMNIYYIYLNSY